MYIFRFLYIIKNFLLRILFRNYHLALHKQNKNTIIILSFIVKLLDKITI